MEEGRKKISVVKALHCSWVDFMTHTSMHGVKYICEDGRKPIEKMFWSVIMISGIFSTSFMVKGIYNRYTSHPTMSTIESTHYPIWVFPFPGVTICNSNRILKSKAEALIRKLTLPKNVSEKEILEDFKYLGGLKDPEFPANERFEKLQDILDDNRYTIKELMLKLGQTCEEMFEKCSWENRIVNCSDFFEIRKSHHGFCCSFNHFGVKDSKSKKHSKMLWKVEGEPRRTLMHGPTTGISVLINPMLHEYFLTDYAANGITVLIHHAEDYPDETVTEKMIAVGKEVLMPITVSALHCSEAVRKLSIFKRKCVFPDEYTLYFFPQYRYRSCIAECVMNRTIQLCGCVPYYYPDNGVFRTCDLDHVDCLYNHFEMLHSRKPVFQEEALFDPDVSETIEISEELKYSTDCNCPKPCNIICYKAETTIGDLQGTPYTVNPFINAGTNVTDRILLHVYLDTDFGQLINRDVQNSLLDLISNLGGVVCLFLGCSFVTLVEIFYFFTIRFTRKKDKMRRRHRGTGFDCPLTPRAIRDLRYPSVRKQAFRTIRVLPQKVMTLGIQSE